MYGTAARMPFGRVTERCREGQGEDRVMSLSHRYIKGVAKVASFVGCRARVLLHLVHTELFCLG